MSADLLTFSAPIELTAAAPGDESKPVKIAILAYAGGQMNVGGFGQVVVDLAGLDISRAVPLLAEHKSDLAGLLGTGQASTDGRELHVNGVLSRANELTQRIVAMHRDGVLFSASIGAQPLERQSIPEGQVITVNKQTIVAGRGGLTLVRRSVLRETSIVAVAADADSSVAIAASLKGTHRMNMDETTDQVNAELRAALPENQPDMTDMERVQARWRRTKWHDQSGPRQRAEKAMISAAAGRISYADFERTLLEEKVNDSEVAMIRAERPKGPTIYGSSHDVPGGEGAVLEAALLSHLGHEGLAAKTLGEPATATARSLGLNSLHDIMRASLQQQGIDAPAGRNEMIRAAFSTASVAGILGNAANKISVDSYRAAPSVARVIARKLTANDFKDHTGYRLTADATFEEVGNAGEITHGALGESSFTFSVATHARMFGLTRQDVVNDDLGKFEEVPRLLGRGAATKLERLFWTMVLANTGSFFHGDNNYISGADSALGITGLGLAVGALRKLVDANGDPISITPKFLVVPPELEAVADQLFASTNVLVQSDVSVPDSNPYKGKYQPQVSPYLSNANYSGNSGTAWYLFGDPSDVAAFGIAYLDGQENPTIEQADADFNTLGIQFRGFMDFGVCQIDKAGAVKSAGV